MFGTRVTMYAPAISIGDEWEEQDRQEIQKLADQYLQTAYPEFEPEILTRMGNLEVQKEYYLPALKVLNQMDGEFLSPDRGNQWIDGELSAVCQSADLTSAGFSYKITDHVAPNESCDCGIYGSVNLEEISTYLFERQIGIPNLVWQDSINFAASRKVLCIVEPSPDAKVILCRKGWKASHVFISEIVGETISWEDTSQLLSMTWKRTIDLSSIRGQHENR